MFSACENISTRCIWQHFNVNIFPSLGGTSLSFDAAAITRWFNKRRVVSYLRIKKLSVRFKNIVSHHNTRFDFHKPKSSRFNIHVYFVYFLLFFFASHSYKRILTTCLQFHSSNLKFSYSSRILSCLSRYLFDIRKTSNKCVGIRI